MTPPPNDPPIAEPPVSRRIIAVLADDLSGAAELAGAALRYGLTAEVTTQTGEPSAADVCCINADTRTLPMEDAIARTARFAADLCAARPKLVFKKTDSLLRGHVAAELNAILRQTGQPRALLCPANPGRGRIVRAGRYYVDGVPLDQTMFAHDPTHPRRTAMIRELLGPTDACVQTPDTLSQQDLRAYADLVDATTIPAGGIEFFEAILASRGHRLVEHHAPRLDGNRLFVCGSPAAWSIGRSAQAAHHGIATVRLDPAAAVRCAAWLVSQGQVQLAIGDCAGEPQAFGESLASAVAEILSSARVDLVFLEGGATATAVLNRLGWTRLRASAEIAAGTVLLEDVRGRLPRLVIKPGSYPWPDAVWNIQ